MFLLYYLPMKTLEEYFCDWEATTFGFGYGTGERPILAALQIFMECTPPEKAYDYALLEEKLTPTVAWLLINALCGVDILEYGSSPRFAWLTKEGKALREFVVSKTLDELTEIVCGHKDEYVLCYPDYCNCETEPCHNPFWRGKR
jgi:hypothetical protein